MIDDGRTGWLAPAPPNNGLAKALRRALDTPTAKIAEMGCDAASRILRICDKTKIAEKQIDFRRQLAGQGPKRSLQLPVNLPNASPSVSDQTGTRRAETSAKGIAIVLTGFTSVQDLDQCMQSVKRQSRPPASVVVVDHGSTEERTLKALAQAQRDGWQVIRVINDGIAAAKNAGINAVLGSGIDPIGFAFLSAKDRLGSSFIAVTETVLQRCPEVGLVSCWVQHSRSGDLESLTTCPSFPYQWLSNEAVPFSLVRTEALIEAGFFRSSTGDGYEQWDLFNAVMAAGWAAVTVPEKLGRSREKKSAVRDIRKNGHEKAHRELLERFPVLVASDAKEIAFLGKTTRTLGRDTLLLRERFALARVCIQYPRESALRVLARLKYKLLRRSPRVAGIIWRLSNLA